MRLCLWVVRPLPQAASSQKWALQKAAPLLSLGSRLSLPLGPRFRIRAESLRPGQPRSGWKSHCPCLEGGAVLDSPPHPKASAPLSFFFKIHFKSSLRSEGLWVLNPCERRLLGEWLLLLVWFSPSPQGTPGSALLCGARG